MGKFEDFQEGFTGLSKQELEKAKKEKKDKKRGFLEKMFVREPHESEDEDQKKKKKRYSKTKSMFEKK